MSGNTPLWQLIDSAERLEQLKQELDWFNRDICGHSRAQKYQKMRQDPFVFYRGTAHLYYQDLHRQQVIANSAFSNEASITWLQGDLHVENYGAFCDGTGDVIYDLNDFDESWIDCYLYDLYRLAVSLLLVIERQDTDKTWDVDALMYALSDGYLSRLLYLKDDPLDKEIKITEEFADGKLAKFITKAKAANSRQKMLDKWTLLSGGERYFDLRSAKLEFVDEQLRATLIEEVEGYHHRLDSELKGKKDYFRVVDVAKRVQAGTGSLGIPRYYVLIDGNNEHEHDYRILDVKQQDLPSHYPYLSDDSANRMRRLFPKDSQGCRVAAAQKAMHVHADDHLGSVFVDEHSYSVRERSPYKKTLNTAKLTKFKHIEQLARQWGSIVATAHARADRNFDCTTSGIEFEETLNLLTQNRVEQFHQEILSFAKAYTKQVKLDFEVFLSLTD